MTMDCPIPAKKGRKNGKSVRIITVRGKEIAVYTAVKDKLVKHIRAIRANSTMWYCTQSLIISGLDEFGFMDSPLFEIRIDARRVVIKDCDLTTTFLKALTAGPLRERRENITSLTLRPLYNDENLTFSLIFDLFPNLKELIVNCNVLHMDWVTDIRSSGRNKLLKLEIVNRHGGFKKLFSFDYEDMLRLVDAQPKGFHLRLIHWMNEAEDIAAVESKIMEVIDCRFRVGDKTDDNDRLLEIVVLNHTGELAKRLKFNL
uniref:F-box domain-containing protein n=1 Tax=Panagrellus redivivus TaxID=6233 RepID=A0A7E4WEA8_PANRE